MTLAIAAVALRAESDVVLARQRARQIAGLLGFDAHDQTRIATAVSEIARNAHGYAGGGRVEFRLEAGDAAQALAVEVADDGPGIADPESVLSGSHRSQTGLSHGVVAARRLVDDLSLETQLGRGTRVTLCKALPRGRKALAARDVAAISAELVRVRPRDPLEEVQAQNQELLRALDELARRQSDLGVLNHELEDTNRGVVALYAELEERADHLRRADDLKSRFLSNMSHEFRTPVNSIQALSRMLLDRLDGDLTPEQERQVVFIRKAADDLSDLVNDLLDLAKVEAGKVVVRPGEFEVANLFGALRGMMRPLQANDAVPLIIDEPVGVPRLFTDEAKVAQILRNFISNALKFTEAGEIRVAARRRGDSVEFAVTDTGVGIAPEHLEHIFEEFSQVESPIQRHVKGTGLGLPLCRKLAELLGGSVAVDSTPGVGSTFKAILPIDYASHGSERDGEAPSDPERVTVLVVADGAAEAYADLLAGSSFRVAAARSLAEAHDALTTPGPRALLLDVGSLPGEEGWMFLTELKRRVSTAAVPVLVATTGEDVAKSVALGADAHIVKPIERDALLAALGRLVDRRTVRKILIVDDEEISRYLLRQSLARTNHLVIEAHDGRDGLRLAQTERPDLICLDLTMPEIDGFELLRHLKNDPATRPIPVLVVTSRALEEQHGRLLTAAAGVLSKEHVAELPALVDETLRAEGGPS
jgi:signal transduction histidine kinase/CheY-like chemotaxis protein